MLKVALVGAGEIGKLHAWSWRHVPDSTLTAVIDPNLSAAKEAAGPDCPVFMSLDEALNHGDFEVVDVCTPTPNHESDGIKALEAGKHLLIEKPLSGNVESCKRLIAARRAGQTAMCAHILRFYPEFEQGRQLVLNGAVGKPAMIRTRRAGKFLWAKHSWRADKALSGGVCLDLIIHDFDWISWTFGPVARVFARGTHSMKGGDYALVTLRMKSGAIAHVEGNWMLQEGFETSFEIAGDAGLLDFRDSDSASFELTVRESSEKIIRTSESPLAVNPFVRQVRHFAECIRENKKPLIPLEEGLEAVRIANAAIESIETGQAIELEEVN